MTAHTISTSTTPSLYYRRSGQGPALLLIHGFPATGSLWDDVARQLEQDFTLLIPDLPGAGNSRLEGESISIEAIADCMKAILDDAQVETAAICGHSMGGYIALAFAKKYPDRMAGLTLVHSTAAADDAAKKALREKTIALIRKGGKEGFIREFIPTLYGTRFKETQPQKVKAQAEAAQRMPEATMIAFYTAMMERPDSLEALQDMDLPVQWVIGGEDALIPYDKMKQQTYEANVSFVSIYPQGGHMSMTEHPDQLAADLRAFGDYCFTRMAAHQKKAVL